MPEVKFLGVMCTICTEKTKDLVNAGNSDSECDEVRECLKDILKVPALPPLTFICFDCNKKVLAYSNFKLVASENMRRYINSSTESDEAQMETDDEIKLEITCLEEESSPTFVDTSSKLPEKSAYFIPKPTFVQMNNFIDMNTDLIQEYKKLKKILLKRLSDSECRKSDNYISKSTPNIKSQQLLKCRSISTRRNKSFSGMSNIKPKIEEPICTTSLTKNGVASAENYRAISSSSATFNVSPDEKYKCKICQVKFNSEENCLNHAKHHVPQHFCSVCQKCFFTHELLIKHKCTAYTMKN